MSLTFFLFSWCQKIKRKKKIPSDLQKSSPFETEKKKKEKKKENGIITHLFFIFEINLFNSEKYQNTFKF